MVPDAVAVDVVDLLEVVEVDHHERDRLVLRLRLREDLTQAEIGRRVGCSQMHVSRILRTALKQLADRAPSPLQDPRRAAHGQLARN